MYRYKKLSAEELYKTLKNVKVGTQVCQYSLKKCKELVPLINEINRLKKEKDAVILAHTYVSPEIIYGVADYVGDSYGLSKDAMATPAKIIVFAAVRFMGETAQILNPDKEVLIPAKDGGCTLADSINAKDVLRLRKDYPDYTFVCYINTTAEVKAQCDVCVTSANIYDIVERIPNKKIYFLPDSLMGQNLINELSKRKVKKDIKYYKGTCDVHKEYTLEQVHKIQTEYPNAKVVSHPECNPEVCDASDYVGSTSQMLDYMKKAHADQFLMLTECGLSSRLQVEFPEKHLVGTCTLCEFMKSNSLEEIIRVLKNPTDKDRIFVSPKIQARAKKCIEAMFTYAVMKD
jgi:quinolinate synthase